MELGGWLLLVTKAGSPRMCNMERVILDEFVAGIEARPGPGTKRVRNQLGDLFPLGLLETRRCWFRDRKRTARTRSMAIAHSSNRFVHGLAAIGRTVTGLGILEESDSVGVVTGLHLPARTSGARKPLGAC